MVIEAFADQGSDKWNQFIESHSRASLYHRTVWRDIIHQLFGHETHYLYVKSPTGQLVGILPLVRLRSRLFGDYLVSMPYFNYGGAVAETAAIEEVLMRRACALAEGLGSAHIEFRDTCQRDGHWPVRTDKVIMELKLPTSVEALWSSLGSKCRAQIKRPQKEGVEVIHGGLALLSEFYQVFSRNMRDLGTPVYPEKFFAAILEAFPQSASLVVVRHGSQPVAAGFLLGDKDRLEIPWASSVRKFNRIGVNMFLYWEALKIAIQDGYEIFDFGRSSIGSGTYRFKKQWGGQERQLYWHYWLKEGNKLPQLTPTSPKYKLAVMVWKFLPLFIANRLGPEVVKNLP